MGEQQYKSSLYTCILIFILDKEKENNIFCQMKKDAKVRNFQMIELMSVGMI
jgi:hypothetical protein